MSERLSVCIVAYNNYDEVTDAIASIEQNTTAEIRKRIYIVDNGVSVSSPNSVDGFKKNICKYKDVEYIDSRINLGFGRGHNSVIGRIDSVYHAIVNPDIIIDEDVFLEIIDWMDDNKDVGMVIPDIRDENAQAEESSKPTLFTSPEQIIFYGVPGSGKSHEIKHKLETEYKIPEQQQDVFVERTVFHPEYTNADFIGQIMPKLVQGKTDFVFKPGPFTSILKKALCDSQNRYVLVIEEINRGNAAAIFGELFQLLDRIDDESKKTSHNGSLNTYGKGWSEYFVMNSEINNYIRDSDDTFDGKALDLNGIHFSANTGIRLPPNLSILATMNTSDQNVFTLDNAFQRRWEMKLIENVFGDTEEETNQRNAFVDSAKQITWEKFQTAINIKIGKMSEDAGLSSMEDKRLGCWFVKAVKLGNDYIISKDLFAEKVLKYLWDDAFKFCREKVFNGYTNLENLTRDFKGDKEFSVFKDLFSETEN